MSFSLIPRQHKAVIDPNEVSRLFVEKKLREDSDYARRLQQTAEALMGPIMRLQSVSPNEVNQNDVAHYNAERNKIIDHHYIGSMAMEYVVDMARDMIADQETIRS